jgi:hypothetical protein
MRTVLRKTVSILLLAACAAGVDAAEWKIDPTIQFRAGYNDNIRMNIDDEISSAEARLSPSAIFSVETSESGLFGDLRFDFRRFKDDSNLDDNNVRFLTSSYHRMERSELGLDLDLIKDTTLDSQLENTGLVSDRVTRYRVNVGPNWSYNLDERTTARFSYTYSDVQYNNTGENGFVNFHVNSGQASLQRVLNERAVASTPLSYNQTSNDNQVDTKNINLQGGASYQFSETLSASLFAGVRGTETDFSQTSQIPIFSGDIIIGFIPLNEDVTRSDWGYTFSGSLTKNFLRGQTGVSTSRNISFDINGIPIEVTRLGWNNLYRFSETLSGDLDLGFYQSETNNNARSNLNRKYYTLEPKFNWNFTEIQLEFPAILENFRQLPIQKTDLRQHQRRRNAKRRVFDAYLRLA